MKRTFEVLGWLTAVALLAFASHAVMAQQSGGPPIQVNVTVKPAQSAEERVADEFKEKELRRAAEEKMAAAGSARAAETSPKALLARARTVYVQSGTSFFEPVQLQNALLKREEFDRWQLAIIDAYDKRNFADVVIEIDRPVFTYTFTYSITERATGVILATGKITAFNSHFAAPKLAGRIVEELKKARGESKEKK